MPPSDFGALQRWREMPGIASDRRPAGPTAFSITFDKAKVVAR